MRRRLDALGLRIQARLDTPWVDRSFPWLWSGALAVVLAAIGFAVQRQLDGGPTLAVWTQAAWNLEEGRGTVSSLAGGDVVRDQWAFTTLPVLWLGRWLPIDGVLIVTQAVALSLAIVPLWRVARESTRLRLGVAAALLLAYSGAPVLHTTNLTGWTALVPAVPALAWAAWFGRRRRWVPYALCLAVALLSRADVGLVVMCFGILGVTMGDRRSGGITAVVGLAWSLAFLVVVMPEVPRGPMTVGEAVLARGVAPLAVLRDPLRLVTDLVLQPNVGALVVLVGPLLFLPLVVPRFALPAVPPIVLGLVGEEAVRQALGPDLAESFQSTVLLLALVPIVLAAMVALSRIGFESVSRIRVDHRIVAAMVLATVAFFVQVAPASPFNEPWSWGGRDATDGGRMAASAVLDEMAAGAGVTASPQVVALVAERRTVVEMAVGPPEAGWRPTTDAVVIDTTAVDDAGVPLWEEGVVDDLVADLASDGFAEAYRGGGIVLLVRD